MRFGFITPKKANYRQIFGLAPLARDLFMGHQETVEELKFSMDAKKALHAHSLRDPLEVSRERSTADPQKCLLYALKFVGMIFVLRGRQKNFAPGRHFGKSGP